MFFLFQGGITQGPGTGTYTDHTIEILVMLIVAFLLGLLLGYLLWYRYKKMYVELEAENRKLRAKLTDLEKDHASLKYKYDELEKDNKAHLSKIRSLESDNAILVGKLEKLESQLAGELTAFGAVINQEDLKRREGIGPKIEGLLNDDGIHSFKDLSETAVEKLQAILDAAGPNYRIHDPGTWPRQAKLAHEGKWEELDEYQDFLLGGKDPV